MNNLIFALLIKKILFLLMVVFYGAASAQCTAYGTAHVCRHYVLP